MDKRIRESIEACRPASDDLQSPDFADAARQLETDPEARLALQRVQQWDAAITQSLQAVAVPPGLSQRILDRLGAVQSEPSPDGAAELLSGAVAAATEIHERDGARVASPARARHANVRRHWAGGVTAALVACVIVLTVAYWLRPASDLPIEDLADRWQSELADNWQQGNAPRDFAVPAAILVPPARWQRIGRFATMPVVAYELEHPAAGKAMLYVAHMTRPGVPSTPPRHPQWTSGGKAVAYWQSGGRLYVVVFGDAGKYPAFVRSSATPFA